MCGMYLYSVQCIVHSVFVFPLVCVVCHDCHPLSSFVCLYVSYLTLSLCLSLSLSLSVSLCLCLCLPLPLLSPLQLVSLGVGSSGISELIVAIGRSRDQYNLNERLVSHLDTLLQIENPGGGERGKQEEL